MAKSGLGRGLGALIPSNQLSSPQPVAEKGERVQSVPLDSVVPSPFQPRKHFNPNQLGDLVESIRENGIIQPLIVRMVNGKHELIAGERRWRAAREAGLTEVPIIVRAASDREVLELALVENLQRADLNPLEEAEAYSLLINQFKLTQEEVAKQVGRSRVAVANAIRLLALAPPVRAYLEAGNLSVGHAKVLLSLTRHEEQAMAAERIIKDGLTVRQAEKLVESLQQGRNRPAKRKKAASGAASDATWTDIEKRLQQKLGTRIRIVGNGETGRVELDYFNRQDFDRLLELLGLED